MRRFDLSVRAGFGFFAAAALTVYFGAGAAAFLAAALVHEAGHLAAILLTARGKAEIELTAAGAYIHPRYDRPPSKAEEAVILLAGPLAGLAAGAALKGCWRGLFEMSLTLSLVNLLPIRGTDGGSLLRLVSDSAGWGRVCGAISALSLAAAAAIALSPLPRGGEARWLWLIAAAALYLRGLKRE